MGTEVYDEVKRQLTMISMIKMLFEFDFISDIKKSQNF